MTDWVIVELAGKPAGMTVGRFLRKAAGSKSGLE
jgi:hypothetical protein